MGIGRGSGEASVLKLRTSFGMTNLSWVYNCQGALGRAGEDTCPYVSF